ncbi:MAG: PPC domain-containing protein [Chthoniobacteraceae bacterium]
MFQASASRILVAATSLWFASSAIAQDVCIPAPRLLTVVPMGGQVGTSVEVAISGDNLDGTDALLFSTPKITAKAKTAADGKVEPNRFTVIIAPDAPRGVHDARVMTRLGISSVRAFSVGTMAEVVRTKPNNSRETALELKPNSVCNAATGKRAIDFYSFNAVKGKRVVVDCAAAGIDSKLTPVLIIADATGRDLVANRTDGFLDFTPPADGKYLVKVHGLTFQGGPDQFYRLAIMDAPADGPAPRQPSTDSVGSFSWAPDTQAKSAKVIEADPKVQPGHAQPITLPCKITGRFFPAAHVDTFEFAAKKGETWWVEVASARLGLPTNPFVLVQRVMPDGKLTDVAELDDIASPMKPSSNGYSYDGPPYEAGSADPLGKVEIKEDGTYRLQVRNLFGGTRADPGHIYRLIVRKAAPDFALTGWALHMTLRNGDRASLSKPVALRGGATMAFEVVVVRKDGFDGEIDLAMEDLPAGVSAAGLKIPAGKSKGMMLITAEENAPHAVAVAKLLGRAQINGATVAHTCRIASMAWPVKDASQEIPKPRLTADTPVSVSGSEFAPVTIAQAEKKVWETKSGEKLTIPLKVTWRSEFAGTSIKLKAIGDGFEGVKELDVPLKANTAEAVLDFSTLKTPPGEYTVAFYGPAVIKYQASVDAPKLADTAKGDAVQSTKPAPAAPAKDTADIVVSEPIRIVIKPADKK